MKIATGQPEDHPTPLPLDASNSPGVQAPTPTYPGGTEQGRVMPTTAMFGEQAASGEAAVAAAMSYGMSADADRRAHYAADISPLGASYGDTISLPGVVSDESKHTGSAGAGGAGPAG